MPENLLIPSVDLRIGALEEYNRQQNDKTLKRYKKLKPRPCITISREYGCEGYPVAELLRDIMMQKSGDEWVLIDKAVLEAVSNHHSIAKEILEHLGEKNSILNEFMATFSQKWKSHQDYFALLSKYILSLAEQGNVIIMELGGMSICRHIEHSFHFRIYGSEEFKQKTLSRRLGVDLDDAFKIMTRRQKDRDKFNRDFLNQDSHNPLLYDMTFNNDRCRPHQIANVIANFVTEEIKK